MSNFNKGFKFWILFFPFLLQSSAAYAGSKEVALAEACNNGNLSTVRSLLGSGANPNQPDRYGFTSLQGAVSGGNPEVVALLLEYGANPDVTDKDGNTPLHLAVDQGYKPVVEVLLLNYNVKRNIRNQRGKTALDLARDQRRPRIVEVLEDQQPIPVAPPAPALQHATQSPRVTIAYAGSKDAALAVASKNGDLSTVQSLLGSGANPNQPDKDGFTSLQGAVSRGNPEVVALLLEYGANPDVTDKDGNTPLHLAVDQGYKPVVEVLLSYNVNRNIRNQRGKTALDLARDQRRLKIVDVLGGKQPISVAPAAPTPASTPALAPAPHHATQSSRVTIAYAGSKNAALAVASKNGDLSTVQSLLGSGANPNQPDKDGFTSLQGAVYGGNPEVVALLLEYGANPDVTDKDGDTPLHLAAIKGYKGVVDVLLKNGANPNPQNYHGKTPQNLAYENRHLNIAGMLPSPPQSSNQQVRPKEVQPKGKPKATDNGSSSSSRPSPPQSSNQQVRPKEVQSKGKPKATDNGSSSSSRYMKNERAARMALVNEFQTNLEAYLTSDKVAKVPSIKAQVAGACAGGLVHAIPLPLIADLSGAARGGVSKSVDYFGRNSKVKAVFHTFTKKSLLELSEIFGDAFIDRFYKILNLLTEKDAGLLAEDFAYSAYHFVISEELKDFQNGCPYRDDMELARESATFLLNGVIQSWENHPSRKLLRLTNEEKKMPRRDQYKTEDGNYLSIMDILN